MQKIFLNLHHIYERLLNLSRLEINWDGYNAKPIDGLVISKACNTLYYLIEKIRPYQVNPLPTGRVEYKWQGPNGELIVEITHKDRMSYTFIPSLNDTCWVTGCITSEQELLRLIVDTWFSKEELCGKPKCNEPKIHRSQLPY